MLDGKIKLNPLAEKLVRRMSKLDWEELGGCLDIQMGGDGDNGEFMIVLLHQALEDEGII